MSQNTSSAVMQQRTEPRDSLDDYPTPSWATRALCEAIAPRSARALHAMTCREPCANRGAMVAPLREAFGQVEGADIHDYGFGFPVNDYLFGSLPCPVDWTITNPPFRSAEQFISRALDSSTAGVAIFARTALLEGVGRYDRVFRVKPPTMVLQFTERVVLHRGKLSAKGSTATAYCWLIWEADWLGTKLAWVPPCRKRLERKEDYAMFEGVA